jgi:plastocyanin
MKKFILILFTIVYSFGVEHIVDQKNKTYIPHLLNVSVGDTIVFKNSDPYPHISYSSDPINGFHTGIQKQGETKTIKINGKGKFTIKCSIHPNMVMEVIAK